MSSHTFIVKLAGTGPLNNPDISLSGEDADGNVTNVSANLSSSDGKRTWEDKKVTIELKDSTPDNLNISMSCDALTGTTWTLTITENDNSDVYKKTGVTKNGSSELNESTTL